MYRRRGWLAALALIALFAFTRRQPLWPGMLVACLGEAIQLWAAGHLRRDQELTTSGPYAHVRNPLYLGRFLIGLGLLMLPHAWYAIPVYVIAFWVYAIRRVGREEAKLQAIFGQPYLDYCRAVPRWLPRPTPYRAAEAMRFRWANVAAGHEHRNALLLLTCFLLLALRVEYVHLWIL